MAVSPFQAHKHLIPFVNSSSWPVEACGLLRRCLALISRSMLHRRDLFVPSLPSVHHHWVDGLCYTQAHQRPCFSKN